MKRYGKRVDEEVFDLYKIAYYKKFVGLHRHATSAVHSIKNPKSRAARINDECRRWLRHRHSYRLHASYRASHLPRGQRPANVATNKLKGFTSCKPTLATQKSRQRQPKIIQSIEQLL